MSGDDDHPDGDVDDDADERTARRADAPGGESFHPGDDRLLLDAMLGKLATHLRMCGYDTAYVESEAEPPEILEGSDAQDSLEETEAPDPDDAIRERATIESRTLLTRDRELARATPGAVLLTERQIEEQLRELASAGFVLELSERPERCGICNTALVAVGAEETSPDYAPDPAAVDCWRCPDCGQFFWRGSHWADVAETLATVRRSGDTDQ
ncbi:MAG: Mut7-C RNAse domain-containing protein [Haloarculaceae archaeon]